MVVVVVACPPPPQPAASDGEHAEERDERAPGHAATVPAAIERCRINWREHVERERARYEDGMRRLDPEQLVRLGNAAYGAGLCLLMLGEREEAAEWLGRASARWRESWEHATPTSWGRPIGVIKAALIAGDDEAAAAFAALGARARMRGGGVADRALRRDARAARRGPRRRGGRSRGEPARPRRLSARRSPTRSPGSRRSAEARYRGGRRSACSTSFETREEYLEDVPVADTVIVLQALAGRRGVAAELDSPLLPG